MKDDPVRPSGLVAEVAIRTVAKTVVHGGPETLVDQDAVPAGMARTAFIRGTSRMTGEAVLLPPPHRVRIRMGRQTGHALMALGTLLRLGPRMTVVTVLINPACRMRIGMPAGSMANGTFLNIERPGMTGVTVLGTPPCGMRVGMASDQIASMAYPAVGRLRRTRMAGVAVR